MERVHFQQEQMLPELKDFIDKGIFTLAETKQILRRRTAFETALVRRVSKKSDYLRYAAYESALEELRRKRVKRLKIHDSSSLQSYALVRRQLHVLERAVCRFGEDVALWVEYARVARKEGANALVGRITARALQRHPDNAALYVLAASHELAHGATDAARALLQRGIRLAGDGTKNGSAEIWIEYVKMEIGFVEGLRRRWDVLGIVDDCKGSEKEKDPEEGDDKEEGGETGGKSEKARREIMSGAIIKEVISSALEAHPTHEMFTSLHESLASYPSPAPLRKALREHLYDALAKTVVPRGDPPAILAYATRELAELDADAEADVDVVRGANEQLLAAVEREAEKRNGDGVACAYIGFLKEWCLGRQNVDIYLRRYLISSLHALIGRLEKSSVTLSPTLLAAHVRLASRTEGEEEHAQKLAMKYTRKALGRGAADVWLARLQLMRTMGLDDKEVWLEAKGCVQGDSEGEAGMKVWMWGLENQENRLIWKDVLKETMSLGLGKVHEEALIGYATLLLQAHEKDIVRHLTLAYLPTSRVWSHMYREGTRLGYGGAGFLREVFEMWRRVDESSARREMETEVRVMDLGR